jgi:hypothetical protein
VVIGGTKVMLDDANDDAGETVHIPLFDLAAYEAAALFFAVLAYPDDKNARTRFERAICFKAIERMCKDANWAHSHQTLRPSDLLQDRKAVEREYKRGIRLIKQERLIAAKMAAPTDCNVAAVVNGLEGKGAGGAKARDFGYLAPTSLKWLAEISMDLDRLRRRESDFNKGNIVHRSWQPSNHVLHLCLALHMTLSKDYKEMEYCNFVIEDYLNDAGWLMIVIESANSYRNVIPHLFDIVRKDLIHVTWRDDTRQGRNVLLAR